MPAIEAVNLTKRYGALTAVDGVSFAIGAGETFGLLGPNGAGKSTTIGMILGALRPDGGEVRIEGCPDPTRADVRRRIGSTPQSLAIYEDLTAEENLAFFGALYDLSGRTLRAKIDWALEFAGLTQRRKDRVGRYSGGMQRRLNLVCGLMHDPQVILLDEPTVGIDPQSRNLIFDSIEALKQEGRTILYTTHYMEEAERLCDRVAIIDHGAILALDTVNGLVGRHGGEPVVEIEFTARSAGLGDLPGDWDGLKLRTRTAQPMDLLGRVHASGAAYHHLSVERADLESVFLHLTGRTLRD